MSNDPIPDEVVRHREPFFSLHPDSLRLSRWIGGVWIVIIFLFSIAIGIGVWFLADVAAGQRIAILVGLALLFLLVFVAGWIYPKAAYQHASWRINADGLEIRRGVWWRHRIIVPHSRMQHSDIEQGPLQRFFALATLVINTAGTQDASVHLNGLKFETAERLRDELMNGKWRSAETQ